MDRPPRGALALVEVDLLERPDLLAARIDDRATLPAERGLDVRCLHVRSPLWFDDRGYPTRTPANRPGGDAQLAWIVKPAGRWHRHEHRPGHRPGRHRPGTARTSGRRRRPSAPAQAH